MKNILLDINESPTCSTPPRIPVKRGEGPAADRQSCSRRHALAARVLRVAILVRLLAVAITSVVVER